jgi:hypothetical protein
MLCIAALPGGGRRSAVTRFLRGDALAGLAPLPSSPPLSFSAAVTFMEWHSRNTSRQRVRSCTMCS